MEMDSGDHRSVSPWGEHAFACCLTHDIDFIDKYMSIGHWARRMAADVFLRRDPGMLLRRLCNGEWSRRKGGCFRNDFRWLIETEKRLGVSATYFFLVTGHAALTGGYSPAETEDMIRQVEEEGLEAGLHAGQGTACDLERMREEKQRFDAIVAADTYGVRQHFLDFVEPETWRIQAELGFLYDSSYGQTDRTGVFHGRKYPFRPKDRETGEELGIWEIPLTVMDVTLARYQKMTPTEGLAVMKSLVREIRQSNGVMSILWHNSSLDDVDWRGWRDVYLKILDYVLEENGWITGGRETIRRWCEVQSAHDAVGGSGRRNA